MPLLRVLVLLCLAGCAATPCWEALAETAASTAPDAPVQVPEPSAEAMRYYHSGNVLWLAGQALGLAIPAVLLFSGFSARLRDLARRIGRRWFFIVGVYFALYAVVDHVLSLPLAFYSGYVRPHAYGLSNQTLQKWITDSTVELGVGVVMGALFLWVPYLLLRKSPRRWWLYTGALVAPFLFFMMLVQPVFIAPLFNDFGPMKDQALESRILALAERAGIEGGRVYEVNKSVDTKTVNAYVTGFLGTKRIVLWDTLLEKLDDEEVLFVMGHEMGHYVLGHVVRMILLMSVLVLGALFVVHRWSGRLIARHGRRFGFHDLSDIASLPLLILLMNLLSLAVSPAILAYSRHNEHESDRFGLEITRNNHAAATAFVTLQVENLANPRPGWLFKLWRGSHPPIGERVDFMNAYRPWETGEEMRYNHLFKPEAGNTP
jgi:Zn-dependent protease with chaperone function